MKETDQILFRDYLSGSLNIDDMDAFQKRLSTEPEFKESFELYQLMESHLEERHKNQDALQALKDIHEEQKSELRIVTNKKWKSWMSVAASGIIIITSVFFINNYINNNISYSDLYLEATLPSSRGNEKDSLIADALINFKSDPVLTIDKLKNLDVDTFVKNRWISETFAFHQNGDSVLYYLPETSPNKIMRDRVNYLEILSLWQLGQQIELESKLKNLPVDTDDYYQRVYQEILK